MSLSGYSEVPKWQAFSLFVFSIEMFTGCWQVGDKTWWQCDNCGRWLCWCCVLFAIRSVSSLKTENSLPLTAPGQGLYLTTATSVSSDYTSYRSAWAWADVLTEEQNKDIANPAALLRILPHAPGAHSTEFPSVTVQTVSRPASAGQHQEDTGSNQHEGVTRRGAAARHPHGENIFIFSALYL